MPRIPCLLAGAALTAIALGGLALAQQPAKPPLFATTKADVQDQLTFLQDASAAVKVAAREGKCWDGVEKELKLPKYEKWPGYANNLPFVLRRYCALWGRGT